MPEASLLQDDEKLGRSKKKKKKLFEIRGYGPKKKYMNR